MLFECATRFIFALYSHQYQHMLTHGPNNVLGGLTWVITWFWRHHSTDGLMLVITGHHACHAWIMQDLCECPTTVDSALILDVIMQRPVDTRTSRMTHWQRPGCVCMRSMYRNCLRRAFRLHMMLAGHTQVLCRCHQHAILSWQTTN